MSHVDRKIKVEHKTIVNLQTIHGDVVLPLTDEQIIDLARMLQEEEKPIPVHTLKATHEVVGMLIQGRTFQDYPRMILVEGE